MPLETILVLFRWLLFTTPKTMKILTFSLSTVSLRFLIRKCLGNPRIPCVGIGIDILHDGHTILVLFSLLSILDHWSKHLKQNSWRQGRPIGSFICSKQIQQERRFLSVSLERLVEAILTFVLSRKRAYHCGDIINRLIGHMIFYKYFHDVIKVVLYVLWYLLNILNTTIQEMFGIASFSFVNSPNLVVMWMWSHSSHKPTCIWTNHTYH